MEYQKKDLVRLAKRLNNPRRAYLLVNPLQGKHIPVRPSAALEMMEQLGTKLYRRFPDAGLVIGFAETATAIGAAVAGCFGEGCVYIHTTRETVGGNAGWVSFQEEHSHAMDQKLCIDGLRKRLAAARQIILVDDELSTGKTIRNMVAQMRRMFPEIEGNSVVATSIVNRLSAENEALLLDEGILCEFLLRIPNEDCAAQVMDIPSEPPIDRTGVSNLPKDVHMQKINQGDLDPRRGVSMTEYREACGRILDSAMARIQEYLGPDKRVLVVGTEEFMYLPLLLARRIESEALSVSFHATTRSPIEVSRAPGYPLFNGYRLTSFYEEDRAMYLYNLAAYDLAVIMTDSPECPPAAVGGLLSALRENGCKDIVFLCGGTYV